MGRSALEDSPYVTSVTASPMARLSPRLGAVRRNRLAVLSLCTPGTKWETLMSTRQEKASNRSKQHPFAGPVTEPRIPLDDTAIIEDPWLGRIATADGLFVTDEHQQIVAWSSSAQRVLGYSAEEVIGRPCFLVLMGREPGGHPICRRFCRVTANAQRGRGTAAYEVAAHARDGTVKCLSNSVVVLDGGNRTFRVMHLLREVTRHPGLPRQAATPVRDSLDEGLPIAERLTRRELEVLRLLAGGSTVDEIAEDLTISVFTARNHVANVQRKLGARSRLETVLLGMRNGLI